ncbi:MAG: hypothetical protein MHM6MM_004040 [Cercozoa sp. M6MM]
MDENKQTGEKRGLPRKDRPARVLPSFILGKQAGKKRARVSKKASESDAASTSAESNAPRPRGSASGKRKCPTSLRIAEIEEETEELLETLSDRRMSKRLRAFIDEHRYGKKKDKALALCALYDAAQIEYRAPRGYEVEFGPSDLSKKSCSADEPEPEEELDDFDDLDDELDHLDNVAADVERLVQEEDDNEQDSNDLDDDERLLFEMMRSSKEPKRDDAKPDTGVMSEQVTVDHEIKRLMDGQAQGVRAASATSARKAAAVEDSLADVMDFDFS